MREHRVKNMLLSALLVALVTVGAYLRIPTPWATLTMQLPFALLAGLLLGRIWGTAAMGIYVAAGLVGLPVFAGGGGFAYVLQPTFGYILALVPAVLAVGILTSKDKTPRRLVLGALCGILVVYAIGVAYAIMITSLVLGVPDAGGVVILGALITLPKDILLGVGAGLLSARLLPILKKI